MYNVCMHYSMHSQTGKGFQLVKATGVIAVGYFSIDSEFKKEQHTSCQRQNEDNERAHWNPHFSWTVCATSSH